MMAVFFLIGARLLNYLVNPGMYNSGLHLTSLRFAGFSFYGGLLGAFGALLIWSRLARGSAWPLLDALVLPSALAFAFARTGCYLNGCCGGKATDSFLGVVFPVKEAEKTMLSSLWPVFSAAKVSVYPTQLFEAALALLGLVPALWLYFRKKATPGTAFLVYGVWFSAMRRAILPLRSLPYPHFVIQVAYPALYGLIITVGLVLLVLRNKKAKAEKPQ